MTSASNKFSNRILSVSSAVIPEILGEPALVAMAITGTEGVDSLFDYQVILKTPDSLNHLISETTNFNTATWLGEEMSVQIQLEGNGKFVAGQMGMSGMGNVGAGVREINGIIDDAKFLREEGRYAFYEVKLKPWLFAATLVSDCKIYQNKTVKEVIDESLSELNYPIEWRLIDSYPKRDYTTQFNESTFEFVSRLCETWGISYFFEHSDGKHRVIFTDYFGGYRPNPSEAYQTVRFHTPNAKIDEEYIHTFVPTNKLASGAGILITPDRVPILLSPRKIRYRTPVTVNMKYMNGTVRIVAITITYSRRQVRTAPPMSHWTKAISWRVSVWSNYTAGATAPAAAVTSKACSLATVSSSRSIRVLPLMFSI